MYKLREAKYEDFPIISMINGTIENIHLAANEENIEEDFFEKIITEESRKLYLVEKAGKVIAFMLFRIDIPSSIIYIDKMSIVLDFEKKGLDEHLYQKVERLAEKKGIKQLIATITTNNSDVHNFFERKGWIHENSVYQLDKG